MQSRLASTATKIIRVVLSATPDQYLPRSLATLAMGRTAEPAIHSHDPCGIYAEAKIKQRPKKEFEPFVSPKPVPHASAPKLESTGVPPPVEPITMQKHENSTSANPAPIENVSCAGLDGTPWPEDTIDWRRQRKEQEEYDREYFQHHKASPLSEIEVADTRKPITRATDGTAGRYYDVGGETVILWRPEQLDTAEDSLRRAMEIWKQSAMRGDPDSPHGRVLRVLRGEDW